MILTIDTSTSILFYTTISLFFLANFCLSLLRYSLRLSLFYLGQILVPLASDLEGACNVSPPFVTISTTSRSLQSRYLIDLHISYFATFLCLPLLLSDYRFTFDITPICSDLFRSRYIAS